MNERRAFIYLKCVLLWLKFHQVDYKGKYKLLSLVAFITMQYLKTQKHLKLSDCKYHLWSGMGLRAENCIVLEMIQWNTLEFF